jgi:2-iminobutanoate/2-iminopropanoate deaminase
MKNISFLSLLAFFCISCDKSDEKIRTLVQEELQKAYSITYHTSAKVIGPYSLAINVGRFLFISGQIGMEMNTFTFPGKDIESQTKQALTNLSAILKSAGYDSSNVIQCTVYLRDMKEFQRMNLIYGGFFHEGKYPTRTTVEVSNLPKDARIEITAVAFK